MSLSFQRIVWRLTDRLEVGIEGGGCRFFKSPRRGVLVLKRFNVRLALFGFSALAAMTAVAIPAQAQTLADAATLAIASNPSLQAARARLEGTREQTVQARAQGRMSASADASATIQGSVARDFRQDLKFNDSYPISASASASQPLYLGGRMRADIDQADAVIAQAQAQLMGLEISVLNSVVIAYSDVLRFEQVVKIRQNNVAVLTKQLEAAQARFEVGEITKTDVAQAQARLAASKTDLVGAGAQLSAARAPYARVVGEIPGTLSAQPNLPTLPASLDDALALARASSPSLASARFAEIAAQAAARRAKSENNARATLTAGVNTANNLGFSNADSYSASIGARLSVPLFTGGLNESRTRAALANASAARISIQETDRQITEQVTNAWRNYGAAQATIESTTEQVKASEIAFEGAELELQVGLRTTLDLLNQEQELLTARLALVTAQRDTFVAAHGLLAAMGRLLPETVGATRAALPEPEAGKYAQPLPIEKPLLAVQENFEKRQ